MSPRIPVGTTFGMDASLDLEVDALVIGGGAAGLWLLDEFRRRQMRVLLIEAFKLGMGQTASAQGILHGGLKYSLAGLLSSSARMVREMPAVWQAALAGRSEPDLSSVKVRSSWCYLWRSQSLKSWTSMLAAVAALEVKPVALPDDQVPRMLAGSPRPIYRLDEPVIDSTSLLAELLRRNAGLVWQTAGPGGLQLRREQDVPVAYVRGPAGKRTATLRPRVIILAAGGGNAALREELGLGGAVMQRRPLRVALVRGDLPPLFGHCIEGAKTRVTVTSAVDREGRVVWQLGGQVSELGVGMSREAFLKFSQRELAAVLPGWQPRRLEWTEFAVDRAERSTTDGAMPGDVQVLRDGPVLTVWPTKLVMTPLLARRVIQSLDFQAEPAGDWQQRMLEQAWPAATVEPPPWERELAWIRDC
jgi:glycine/D-amino acid oxidase-like deaminating enzyme